MAIRDILFHLEASELAQSVSDFAVSLADVTGAHLTAAGVVIEYPPPAADLGGFTTGWDFSSAQVFAEISDRNRKAAEGAYDLADDLARRVHDADAAVFQRHFDSCIIFHGCSSPDAWSRSLGLRFNTIILRDSHPIWLCSRGPAHYGI